MNNLSLSPLDGRYAKKLVDLAEIFSEYGLMKYRLQVEVEWLIQLSEEKLAPSIEEKEKSNWRKLYQDFSAEKFAEMKKIEATTNHDVKAVEIWLNNQIDGKFHAWVHFGCTSEDINSTSYALMLTDGKAILLKNFQTISNMLREQIIDWKAVPMLSRTHGQSATPTTVGKELAVFGKRLSEITERINNIKFPAKFSGATGNFGAHQAAMDEVNWLKVSEDFVENKLKIGWNFLTTQIEPHDTQVQCLQEISLASSVLIDLSRDIWGYISLGYFGQKVVAGEVGSSTMPHKVNPIDFENAEGNLKLARGIAQTLSNELPISRWQRDLTDSTLQRNFGLVWGHCSLALQSLAKGLSKLKLNEEKLSNDLENSPEVLTEAVQTALRAEGIADAYDQLKNFSRGKALSLKELREFIEQSALSETRKKKLKNLTPSDYIGASVEIVDKFLR